MITGWNLETNTAMTSMNKTELENLLSKVQKAEEEVLAKRDALIKCKNIFLIAFGFDIDRKTEDFLICDHYWLNQHYFPDVDLAIEHAEELLYSMKKDQK